MGGGGLQFSEKVKQTQGYSSYFKDTVAEDFWSFFSHLCEVGEFKIFHAFPSPPTNIIDCLGHFHETAVEDLITINRGCSLYGPVWYFMSLYPT